MVLGRLFARQDDPYAGADMRMVVVAFVPVWLVSAAVALALLPIAPPTMRVGDVGWVPALAVVAVSLAVAVRLRRKGAEASPDELLFLSYLGIAGVALLQFLTGGNHSPFASLFLLWAISTAAAHPPRRTIVFLGVVSLAVVSSLFYDHWDTLAAASIGVQLFLILALSLMATVVVGSFRAQRTGLREEGEVDRRSARTDPLTGLGNRRAFDEALATALEHAGADRPLSLLVADVDHFKEINDVAGHLNGDHALRGVARGVLASVRDRDGAFRWGGDEFVVLLADTGPDGSDLVARRMHRTVSDSCRRPDGRPLSITIGAAHWSEGMTAEELLGSADLALMGAKLRSGAGRATGTPAPDPHGEII